MLARKGVGSAISILEHDYDLACIHVPVIYFCMCQP